MKSVVIVLLGLLVAPQDAAVGKVESEFDKKVNFSELRTYAWTSGYDANRPDAHKAIVAAFEAQMASLGLTKVASGADVTLAYYTVASFEVDLKDLEKMEREGRRGIAPTKGLGRLVVMMRGTASNQRIWAASTREYLDPDTAKLPDTIRTVTARLFDTYPGRKPARKQ